MTRIRTLSGRENQWSRRTPSGSGTFSFCGSKEIPEGFEAQTLAVYHNVRLVLEDVGALPTPIAVELKVIAYVKR